MVEPRQKNAVHCKHFFFSDKMILNFYSLLSSFANYDIIMNLLISIIIAVMITLRNRLSTLFQLKIYNIETTKCLFFAFFRWKTNWSVFSRNDLTLSVIFFCSNF